MIKSAYIEGQRAACARLGVKEAALSHLLAGPLGHIGMNAMGRAAHHGSNLAEVLAHKGLQHGLTDSVVDPAAMRSLKLLAGPESVTSYELAAAAGRRLAAMAPEQRAVALAMGGGAALPNHMPVFGPLQKAIAHERAGTAPALEAEGLGAKAYGKLVDKMTNVVNGPFDTGAQRAVKSAVGAAPAAAIAAADPVGSAAHFGINAIREIIGKSSVGKKVMKTLFDRGLQGEALSPAREAAVDYLVSPSVLDPMRIGKTLSEHGVTPAHLDRAKGVLQEVRDLGHGFPIGTPAAV